MSNFSSSTHALDTQINGEIITQMDALSQSGFSAVAALAKKALAGLNASTHSEGLAADLSAIWAAAEQFGNDINVKAEEAGRNHIATH